MANFSDGGPHIHMPDFSDSGPSNEDIKFHLQSLLDSKEKQLQQAGTLGQRVLAQQMELEERIRQLQEETADGDEGALGEEAKERYRELAETIEGWNKENATLSSAFGNKVSICLFMFLRRPLGSGLWNGWGCDVACKPNNAFTHLPPVFRQLGCPFHTAKVYHSSEENGLTRPFLIFISYLHNEADTLCPLHSANKTEQSLLHFKRLLTCPLTNPNHGLKQVLHRVPLNLVEPRMPPIELTMLVSISITWFSGSMFIHWSLCRIRI